MKNKIIFSLTCSTLLLMSNVAGAVPNGYGIIVLFPSSHEPGCCDMPYQPEGCPPCTDGIPYVGIGVSTWLDPGLIAATALDLAATKKQNERSIDAENALKQLEDSLKGNASCSGSSGDNTSLEAQSVVPVVPFGVEGIESNSLTEVRKACTDFLFYSDDCKNDCVVERQNTWLLTSVELAAASGDQLLAAAKDEKSGTANTLKDEFANLKNEFNRQTSPKAMWAASSQITLHTHIQQNDINALYARDLEMNGLNGVRASEDVKMITHDPKMKN